MGLILRNSSNSATEHFSSHPYKLVLGDRILADIDELDCSNGESIAIICVLEESNGLEQAGVILDWKDQHKPNGILQCSMQSMFDLHVAIPDGRDIKIEGSVQTTKVGAVK